MSTEDVLVELRKCKTAWGSGIFDHLTSCQGNNILATSFTEISIKDLERAEVFECNRESWLPEFWLCLSEKWRVICKTWMAAGVL